MIDLTVPDNETNGFEGASYYYALRRISDGSYKTLAHGTVVLKVSAASVLVS